MQNWQSPQPTQPLPAQPVMVAPSSDERLMALLAHLSLLVPHAGIVAPLLIWLFNKDKAPFAAYQAKQALFFHLFVIVATYIAIIIGFIFVVLTLGLGLLVLVPLIGALSIVPMICGIIGAIHSYEGRDFRYPIIGDMVRPD